MEILKPKPLCPTIKDLITIHKPKQPIRPIVNWRNAPLYKLSKLFTQENQATHSPDIYIQHTEYHKINTSLKRNPQYFLDTNSPP